MQIQEILSKIIASQPTKIIISKPGSKTGDYKKMVVLKKQSSYQIEKYTEKQVFHENVLEEELLEKCLDIIWDHFYQVNAWSADFEHILLISKKGSSSYKRKALTSKESAKQEDFSHNRQKNYLIEEGTVVPPLVDMGIFTKEGKVVRSMYDKFRQINRFLEMMDDVIKEWKSEEIKILDFGCGKSYLTFIMYYYLTEIRGIRARILGLDLKADVIEKCSQAAEKYGYDGLTFEKGDIEGYEAPFEPDMVITLHACDTATDFALYNAIRWKAKMIFSVPCCQHELNGQMKSENFNILSRYGIMKERFSALATDVIRGNLLEYMGYKTQLLEFVDFTHTPKNILIRAVKRPVQPKGTGEKALKEAEALMEEFQFQPMLYKLLPDRDF